MRLDARRGDIGWNVWHVPRCRPVRLCVWVDDVLKQYAAWDSWQQAMSAPGPLTAAFNRLFNEIGGGNAPTSSEPPVHQAERILILQDRRLVLIDPIDDNEPEATERDRTAPMDEDERVRALFALIESTTGDQPRLERGREGMEAKACESAMARGTAGAPALATLPHYASPGGGPMGTGQPSAEGPILDASSPRARSGDQGGGLARGVRAPGLLQRRGVRHAVAQHRQGVPPPALLMPSQRPEPTGPRHHHPHQPGAAR